jgi:hypothetical protein
LLLLVVLFSLTSFLNAQKPVGQTQPVPALSSIGENTEASVNGDILVRGGPNTGEGMNASLTHYFTRHFGVTADADILKSDFRLFREYGYRAGPSVTFLRTSRIQPFVQALFGYSRFKETVTGPRRPYVSGFSYMMGAGGDVRLVGPVFARLAVDGQVDPSTHGNDTHVLRISFGLAYKFGRSRF